MPEDNTKVLGMMRGDYDGTSGYLSRDMVDRLREAEARVENERGTLDEQLAEQERGRGELAAAIPDKQLSLYERIRGGNRSSGSAVCAVHGMYCQGCQMEITPQQYADLVAGNKVVLCRTCQRILALEL